MPPSTPTTTTPFTFSTSRTLVVLLYLGWAVVGAFVALELLRVPRSPIPARPAPWTPPVIPRSYSESLSGSLHPVPVLRVVPGAAEAATATVAASGLVTAVAGTREAAIAAADAALALMASSPRAGTDLDTAVELVLVLAVEDSEADAGADHTLLDTVSRALEGFAARFEDAVRMRVSRATVHHAGRLGSGGKRGERAVSPAELSDYVNAAEWGLGAGSVSDPLAKVIHLVAVLPSSRLGRPSLTDHRGQVSAARGLLVPGWGGICLLPAPLANSSRPELPEGAAREAAGLLITQLRSIIGISVYRAKVDTPSGAVVTFEPDAASGVTEWEVRELLLSRMVRHLGNTEEAIAHLGTMADKLQHLVVRESISVAAKAAVQAHAQAQQLAARARWLEAYSQASQALTHAKLAFSDRTLLTTLYFPDENKAAIYLPLILPLIVPIIRALRRCIAAKREKRQF
jgi:hypothetical protein